MFNMLLLIGLILAYMNEINSLSFICNLPVLKMSFHAHIQSHIAFGIVYGGTSEKNTYFTNKALRTTYSIMILGHYKSVRRYFLLN